ncbi:exodeoxyribonuclease VII small subunit [uncultured Dialister sp.]|uniref:exodeoxyribonuclease VII small subunit n=1 Tax=uncultured Dialister sp. TaxID=278064 RepID=UPI0026391A53|nr:exodeoxyribonuclease VII small subunit [uncultured Dialister sp.]
MDNKSLTFEESMNVLKDAARRISSGDAGIDEIAAVYKEGMAAAAHCLSILNEVDGELTVISQKTEELLEKEMEPYDSGSAEDKTETHQ